MTSPTTSAPKLDFQELDPLDAPGWSQFYNGLIAGLTVVGIGVAIAT